MTRLNKVIELQLDGKTWIADRIDPNKLGSWSIRQFLGEVQCPVVTDVCSCLLVDWRALASIVADPPWKHRSDMLQPHWVTRTQTVYQIATTNQACHMKKAVGWNKDHVVRSKSQAMCVSSLAESNRSCRLRKRCDSPGGLSNIHSHSFNPFVLLVAVTSVVAIPPCCHDCRQVGPIPSMIGCAFERIPLSLHNRFGCVRCNKFSMACRNSLLGIGYRLPL